MRRQLRRVRRHRRQPSLTGELAHRGREVGADHRHALLPEVGRDVPRPRPAVEDRAGPVTISANAVNTARFRDLPASSPPISAAYRDAIWS